MAQSAPKQKVTRLFRVFIVFGIYSFGIIVKEKREVLKRNAS